ncbi:MAG: hypothetical protein M1819_001079 [Sarea resinae]|nr:MAG: hypothetical protein M1819_001079 [Sarea resinae]
MANNITLWTYLQQQPPALPISPPAHPSRNTTNKSYSFQDIRQPGHWDAFNLQEIVQRYGTLLHGALIEHNPMPTSPPSAVGGELALTSRIHTYFKDRIRRAIRSGITHARAVHQIAGLTVLEFDVGDMAATIENYRPDLAYFDPTRPYNTGPNRLPGDIKPSWKWHMGLQNSPLNTAREEFRQALSQVNYYMNQHHSRYGFILTDRELVAIRKQDTHGNLDLSDPIPWRTVGDGQAPILTLPLALWYLGMLAAQDQGPERWNM